MVHVIPRMIMKLEPVTCNRNNPPEGWILMISSPEGCEALILDDNTQNLIARSTQEENSQHGNEEKSR